MSDTPENDELRDHYDFDFSLAKPNRLATKATVIKPSVYIETTIPSFYHEVRTEPEMVARRSWTREW